MGELRVLPKRQKDALLTVSFSADHLLVIVEAPNPPPSGGAIPKHIAKTDVQRESCSTFSNRAVI